MKKILIKCVILSFAILICFMSEPAYSKNEKPRTATQASTVSQWQMVAVFGDSEEQKKLENQLAQKVKGVDSIEHEYVMQRNVRLGKLEIPMGTVTQFVFKRASSALLSEKQSEAEARHLTEEIRQLVAAPEWYIEKKDHTISFYSDWLKYNRLVRVVYKDLGTHYAFSVAISRRGYAVPVFSEAISMQDTFAGQLSPEKTAFNFKDQSFWRQFLKLPEAQAQTTSDWQQYLNYLRTAGGGISPGQLQSFDIWTKANIGAPVNGLASAANNLSGSVNSGINKITDPMTALKLGLAGGLGGAIGVGIGGPLMSFAVGGIVELSSSIWHNIVGTLSDEQDKKLKSIYGESFKTFEDSARELNAIESDLDKQILAMALASDMSPDKFLRKENPLDVEQALRKTAGRDQSRVRVLTSEMDKVGADEKRGFDCPEFENLNATSVSFGMHAKLFNSLADHISKFGGDKSQMCQSIQGLLDKWASAEGAIYYAKNQMLKSFQAHIMSITSDVEKFNQTMGSKRALDNACLEPIRKLTIARQNTESPDPNCLREKAKLIQTSSQFSWNPSQDAIQRCSELAQISMIDNLNSFSDFCLEVSTVQGELNHSSYLETAIANAKRNIDIAHGLFNSLSRADCVRGVSLGVCDGSQNGSFTEQQQRYEHIFASGLQYCPNLKSHKQAVVDDRKKAGDQPDRGPAADPESRVRPEIQCGFFCRMWTILTKPFRKS